MLYKSYVGGHDRNARETYEAEFVYPKKLTFVGATRGLLYDIPDHYWGDFVEEVDIVRVPGTHYSILNTENSPALIAQAINKLHAAD